MATNLLAVAQGTDLRGGSRFLSPRTRPIYDFIRKHSKKVIEDRPLHEDLEIVAQALKDGSIMKVVREDVFQQI